MGSITLTDPIFGDTDPIFGDTDPIFRNTDPIFGDILNDTVDLTPKNNIWDYQFFDDSEPTIDMIKLRWEFSAIYLNNEIFYQQKIKELNDRINFEKNRNDNLKESCYKFYEYAVAYKEKYEKEIKKD